MTATDIKSAINTLNPLLQALEAAYWDASDVNLKDRIFDLVSCSHAELSELAKLSVSDLEFPYEPISPELSACSVKLLGLAKDVEKLFPRSKTSAELSRILPEAAKLINGSC